MAFSITTPIYYVNSDPHLGHAYTTTAGDVLARHHRARGEDVFFLTGTDEHGGNVARAAAAAGMEPKEFCDQVSARFRAMGEAMRSSHDFFIRTTDPEHERRVQDFVQVLKDRGRALRGDVRRALLQLLRGLLRRERPDPAGQLLPAAPDAPGRVGGGAQLVLPAHQVGAEAARAVRRRSRVRSAPGALQRGALADRRRPRGRLVQPGDGELGRAGAVGARPDDLRLGGRAAQLPHGARVRPRPRRHRRVLADVAAPDGQGHPAPARDHLAGDADGGGVRPAEGPVRARLLHQRRPEDEQDARERDRSVRGDRQAGRGRPAVLPAA